MSQTEKKSLITPKALLSYPHLHQPQASQTPGGKAKYSCSLVFTPEFLNTDEGKAKFQALQTAAMAAGKAKWGDKFETFLKGDGFKKGFRTDGESKGYPAGSIYINVRTEQKPGIVYADLSKMPDEKIKEEMYPGAIVRASVVAFAFETNGNRGLSFALNNLQLLGKGERLDNRVAAEKEFDADLTQAPADLSALVG